MTPILNLGRETWTQVVVTVLMVCGVIVTMTLWIVNSNNSIAVADMAAMAAMDRRVTTLEVEQKDESQSIDRLSISVDQGRLATTDLGTAVTKLSQVIDDLQQRRH